MKKIWKMSQHLYLNWLLSYKQLITLSMLLYIYQSVISPLKHVSKGIDANLHIVEPFVAILNNPLVASIFIIAYLVLVIDLPNTSGNHTFIVWRLNRLQWIFSQCLFTVMSSATFYISLFLFSAFSVIGCADWGSSWSLPAKRLGAMGPGFASSYGASVFVSNNLVYGSSPWDAAVNSLALMITSACLVAFILMFFSIKNYKMYGVILTVAITLIGLGFTYGVRSVQWLFPVPNSIYSLHFYDILCVYKPVYSYIYLISASLIFIYLSCRSVRNFSFSFSIEEQEGN